jgi:adenosylcobinamide kinase/adenosylcobinamide-phosphate guanylyltransferase
LEQDREAKRQSDSHVQVGAQQEITLSEPINQLLNSIACFKGNLLLVTNEVGDGIVPEYKLGRTFRDWAGMLNQRVAAQCDEVFLVTAGIPVELKKLALRMEGVWPMTEHAGESGSSA